MLVRPENLSHETSGKDIPTIYQAGINNSKFTHMSKYLGNRGVITPTGEYVWSEGRNGLKPLYAVYNPITANEMHDIDTNYSAFPNYASYINPMCYVSAALALLDHAKTYIRNQKEGVRVSLLDANAPYTGTVSSYVTFPSRMSIGQDSDLDSFADDYDSFRQNALAIDGYTGCEEGYIAYGVSRGTNIICNALSKKDLDGNYVYPGAKLAVLEGVFYSVGHLLQEKKASILHPLVPLLFNRYEPNGASPGKSIADYPEGLPTLVITSEKDELVPATSSKLFATELAQKGKNDVYLLVLKESKHPSYMFDNENDNFLYNIVINAFYEKYGYKHNVALATLGRSLLDKIQLSEVAIPSQRYQLS